MISEEQPEHKTCYICKTDLYIIDGRVRSSRECLPGCVHAVERRANEPKGDRRA